MLFVITVCLNQSLPAFLYLYPEILHCRCEYIEFIISRSIFIEVPAAALAVSHLAEYPAVGACYALDS